MFAEAFAAGFVAAAFFATGLAVGLATFFAAFGAGFAPTLPLERDEDVFTRALAAFFGAAFFAAGFAAGLEAFLGAAFGAGFAAFFAGFFAMTIPVLKNVRKYSRWPGSIGRPDKAQRTAGGLVQFYLMDTGPIIRKTVYK